MKYKIFDTAFKHTNNMGWHWKSKYGIQWYRGNDHYNTCFFTDASLGQVDNVKCNTKVAIVIEPPSIWSASYEFIKANHHKFNYILTYSQELISIDPNKFLYCPQDPPWIPFEDRKIYNKTKTLSIIASDKKQAPGHRLRHEVIAKYGNKMDKFGCGFAPFKHPKTPMLADYMFSLAIMNSDFDDYYTEILTDMLAVGTVPIFWGTKNIGKYFNADGIIRFDDLDELGYIINSLNHDLYLSKMDAIKDNFNRVASKTVVEDYIYERYPFLFK